MNTTARWIAYQILLELESGKSNSAVLLNQHFARVTKPSDRHLITELVLGTLRWKAKLHFWIDSFSRRPQGKLDPQVVVILQIGIYQLAFTKIAAHGAIAETVDLCRKAGVTSATGLVNAVLRQVQRNADQLPEPNSGDADRDLSVQWSHPEWLVKRWRLRFAEDELVDLLRTNNTTPVVFLRINDLHYNSEDVAQTLRDEGIQIGRTNISPLVWSVSSGAPQLTLAFKGGAFYIQDAAIQLVCDKVNASPGMKLLEVAAAPGGKTVQLASQMRDQGWIVSVDASLNRMRLWRKNMDRLRIGCAQPLICDARKLALRTEFDKVFIDAPCSSLGVIRRHPEIKWRRNAEDLLTLQHSQLEIVNACAGYVRKNGELIYSVCSFEPEETVEVAEKFLRTQEGFSAVGSSFFYPHQHQTDGFFVARFTRNL